MSNIISFVGLRSGVGNSALLRAFAVEAVESLYCVIVDFDGSSSSTLNWALRRKANGFDPPIPVEPFETFDLASERPGIELVMVDASNCGKQAAMDLALISRLVVISTTTKTDDLKQVIDHVKALTDAGLGDCVSVAICRVQSLEEALVARETLTANRVKVLIGEIGERTIGYPRLERQGRALNESPGQLLTQNGSEVVDSIQKAFVDGF
jgi:hypothetical protein